MDVLGASFTSTKFVPVLPDDYQFKSGLYGAELAFWLCQQCAQRFIYLEYPRHTETGWQLIYTHLGRRYGIHVFNTSPTALEWDLSINHLDSGMPPKAHDVLLLLAALRGCLTTSNSIFNVEWFGVPANNPVRFLEGKCTAIK